MKLTSLLMAAIATLVITGCGGGKLAEAGKTENFSYSFAGMQEDELTKRPKGYFQLVNESEKNIASISGTYQVLDKDGKIIKSDTFTKDGYPYLLQAGQKRQMTVTPGTLPSNADSMRLKVSEIRYK